MKSKVKFEKSQVNKKFILILLLIIGSFKIYMAQESTGLKSAVGTGICISGNGLGAFVSPYIQISKNRNSFSYGPLIHLKSKELGGGKIIYSRNLSSESLEDNELFQIHFLSYLQYTNNILLSSKTAAIEKKVTKSDMAWDKVRYNTLEGGAGIEFRVCINKSISIRNIFVTSVYYHTNYIKVMDLEGCALSLSLETGILINF